MARFDGKRILITGGTSGIGLATAKRIVAEGGEVGVTGTSQEHLNEAGRALPDGSLVLRNDASDPDEARELGETVGEKMGKLDGLFLNAGYGNLWPVGEPAVERFDRMMNVNVRGMTLHMAHLKPHLAEGAAVAVTASVAPYLGQAEGAVYGATKAAAASLARAWARDLAPQRIRVNSVSPGPIETNFFAGMELSEEEKEEFKEGVLSMVPLGRMGTDDDVAAVVTFLLSNDAAYVTGSEYVVDGGMTMR